MGVERRRKLLRSDELGAIPPAPSCSVSLNADLAGIYGIDPFDTINAESATSGSTIQGAGLPTFDVTWSGERSIEFVVDQQNASGTFAAHDGSTNPLTTAENDRVTLIINGDDLGFEILINNVSQATGTLGRSTGITVGFANGNSSFADPGVMSFTAYPAAEDIQNGRGSDWCGNEIPAVESGTIQSGGTTATMTFSTTMEADDPAAGWTIEADGSPVTLSSASLSGDLLTVELGETISSTATVTTSYDDSTGTMESTDGVSLSSITDLGMTNNA